MMTWYSVEVEYVTHGKHRWEKSILLPEGDRLLLLPVLRVTPSYASTKKKRSVKVGRYTVTVEGEGNDSSRNIRRYGRVVMIDPEPPFIVHYSKAWRMNRLMHEQYVIITPSSQEEGKLVEETAGTRQVIEDDGVYRIYRTLEKVRVYVEFSGGRFLLHEYERTANFKRERIGLRFKIMYRSYEKAVIVVGDTYHAKEALKQLGYRYDGHGAWFKKVDDKEVHGLIAETVIALKNVAKQKHLKPTIRFDLDPIQ